MATNTAKNNNVTDAATSVDTTGPKPQIFSGTLNVWQLKKEHPRRTYVTLDMEYKIFRKYFKVNPYDPNKDIGVQRHQVVSQVNKLKKAIDTGTYTPTTLAASVEDIHKKKQGMIEIDEKKKIVKLAITEKNPCSVTDGGHRGRALFELRDKATTTDVDMVDAIDRLPITLILSFEPEFIREDFQNHQAGLRVSKSQLAFMQDGKISDDPKDIKTPLRSIGKKVAKIMHAQAPNVSFLSSNVNFIGSGGGRVDYSSITGMGASDLATSLIGGARIVSSNRYMKLLTSEKAVSEFLVKCYNATYSAMVNDLEVEEFEDVVAQTTVKHPVLLVPDKMLVPNKDGGNKSGTGFQIMVGNMLAFRKLEYDKSTDITPEDLELVLSACKETMNDVTPNGGSGPARRIVTKQFARQYFEDAISQGPDDEHLMTPLASVEGIPIILLDDLLKRSTFSVSKQAKPDIENPNVKVSDTDPEFQRLEDEEEDEDEEIQDDTDPNFVEDEEFEAPVPQVKNAKPVKSGNKSATAKMG